MNKINDDVKAQARAAVSQEGGQAHRGVNANQPKLTLEADAAKVDDWRNMKHQDRARERMNDPDKSK